MAASAIAELRTDCVVCVVFTSVPLQEVFADLCSKRRCYRQEGLTESKKDEELEKIVGISLKTPVL